MPIKHFPPSFLTRVDTAAFLTERGLPTKPHTLQSLASNGEGPPYFRWGNLAIYRREELQHWLREELLVERRAK
jgi:hypothetical protein